MAEEFRFVYYGEPVPQGRPKFSTFGGRVRAIDPEKSRNFKDALRIEASRRLRESGGGMFNGAVSLTLKVGRSVPRSFSKSKRNKALEGQIRPVTRPDIDNYQKAVQDALNGTIYKDDSQIARTLCEKFYADPPYIEVVVSVIETADTAEKR